VPGDVQEAQPEGPGIVSERKLGHPVRLQVGTAPERVDDGALAGGNNVGHDRWGNK
jgi:hypothetical protein